MIFKITKKDKYLYFMKPMVLSLVIVILVIIILNLLYIKSFIIKLDAILIIMILPIIHIFLPHILFYFNYYRKDRNVIFTINEDENKFTYKNGTNTILFKREDIKKCIIYLSIPAYHNRTIFAHWLSFFYTKIITSQGTIIITCLTCDSIEDYIPKEKIEKKRSHISHAFPK